MDARADDADSTGRYAFRLFDIGAKTQYAVEANGVRSTTYTIDVSNLPYVKRMDLQYRFPAYTQLAAAGHRQHRATSPRSRARWCAFASRRRCRHRAVASSSTAATRSSSCRPATAISMAMLRVDKPGFYKVELQGPDGQMVTGSLDYTIDVLPDRPPTVQFTKPGRDQKVLSVDEVYTEARAEDDYGVAKLELVYSVNGAPEKTMPLHDGTRAIREISAGYTFMLEGLKLEPGDVVSYYARATDNNARERRADARRRTSTSCRSARTTTTIASARAAVAAVAAAAGSSRRRRPALAEAARHHRRDVQDGARQRADRQEDARRESRDASSVAAAAARAGERSSPTV